LFHQIKCEAEILGPQESLICTQCVVHWSVLSG